MLNQLQFKQDSSIIQQPFSSPFSKPEYKKATQQEHQPPSQKSHSHIKKHKYLSYFCIIVSCIAWVTGYLYSNDNNLDPIQTSMLRGFMIMIVSAALCKWEGVQFNLRHSVKLLMQRNIIFLAQGFIMAIIQFYLPLGVLHTLGVTGPIFVTIWQFIFQRKVPHLNQYIAVGLTIIGIVLVTNGNIFLKLIDPSFQFSSQFANYRTNDPKTIIFCSLLFIFFMLIWAYSVYSTSKMKVSPFLINFLFGAKLYFISCVLYPFIDYSINKATNVSGQVLSPNVDASIFYWGILFNGVLFGIAQTAFVVGLVMAENIGMTSMLTSTNILIAYFVSIVKYKQQINVFCIAGSVLIVIGLGKIMLHS